jgi:phage terminase large subunit-like protein
MIVSLSWSLPENALALIFQNISLGSNLRSMINTISQKSKLRKNLHTPPSSLQRVKQLFVGCDYMYVR